MDQWENLTGYGKGDKMKISSTESFKQDSLRRRRRCEESRKGGDFMFKKGLFVTMVFVIALTVSTVFAAHTHVWGEWKWEIQPTCQKTGRQVRVCEADNCGLHERRTVNTVPHSFKSATCTAPKTCIYGCGTTSGSPLGHSYATATCVVPRTCVRCGATTGGLGAHNLSKATCKTPSKCSVCGYSDGRLGNHYYVTGRCVTCGQLQP